MSLEGWEVSFVGEDILCGRNSRSKGTGVGKCLRGSEIWDELRRWDEREWPGRRQDE